MDKQDPRLAPPHSGKPNGFLPRFKRVSVTLSVGTPRCPYVIAYRGVHGLSDSGSSKKPRCSPLCGRRSASRKVTHMRIPGRMPGYQTSEFPTTSELSTQLPSHNTPPLGLTFAPGTGPVVGTCSVAFSISSNPRPASERRRNNLKYFEGFYLKVKSRIWPGLSWMCHIRSTAETREEDLGSGCGCHRSGTHSQVVNLGPSYKTVKATFTYKTVGHIHTQNSQGHVHIQDSQVHIRKWSIWVRRTNPSTLERKVRQQCSPT